MFSCVALTARAFGEAPLSGGAAAPAANPRSAIRNPQSIFARASAPIAPGGSGAVAASYGEDHEAAHESGLGRSFVAASLWDASVAASLWDASARPGGPWLQLASTATPPPEMLGWLACLAFAVVLATNLLKLADRVRGRSAADVNVAGQPIGVRAEHPCVQRPDFDKHAEEVWAHINELRGVTASIKESVARITALREANAERLSDLGRSVEKLSTTVAHLAGVVESKLEASA